VEEMTHTRAVAILRAANPRHDVSVLHLYAAAFLIYREGSENVTKSGAVVANPRTGEAMPNPYLPIIDKQRAAMLKLADARRPSALKTAALWEQKQ